MDLHDISLEIAPGMLSWPTGRPVAHHHVVDPGSRAEPRNSEWTLDSHAGTHVDAPLHFLPGAADVASVALAAFLGPCRVVEVADAVIGPDSIPADLEPGTRVLFKTENSRTRIRNPRFDPEFVAIDLKCARGIVEARVPLVGVDYLSVESYGGTGEVHRVLLEAGIALLESLDLSAVEPGAYTLCALPLRLAGGEASPVRAVLWR